ncbi:MAG: hypothetical protein HQK59_03000 [Deltaproteobacteria bacterium]|nr:hypothetical protein [Deltaproteobacteria bacterium]MBF0523746.1 hypothetical protein [Deltaproteobacteria bacterium]
MEVKEKIERQEEEGQGGVILTSQGGILFLRPKWLTFPLRIIVICSFSVITLFLGFFMNYWGVADQEWFANHQLDTESSIMGRMVKSRQDGIFSDGGLEGLGSLNNTPVFFDDKPFRNQYLAYFTGRSFGAYTTYNSQIGGQGILLSMLDKFIPLPPRVKYSLFRALTSLLTAISLTGIILWFYLEFGLTAALFVLASAVLSQWLTVFGRNIAWSLWAFYLPIAAIMYYLKFKRGLMNTGRSTFGVIIFIMIFIKCLFSGYDYITTVAIMVIVPFVYYSILDRLNFRKFLAGLFTAAFSSCLAILLSLIILCVQIGSVKGSFLDGIDHLVYSFEKRTHGKSSNFPSEIASSLESSTTHVVATYLAGTYFDATNYLPCSNPFISTYLLKVRYLYLILLFMIMSRLLYFRGNKCVNENEKRKHLALILATWFSILAPLSWFIIFKGHSYIHTHMNYIIWQMPFVFFGFAICGLVVKSLSPNLICLTRHST